MESIKDEAGSDLAERYSGPFFVLGVTNVANRLICVGEDGDGVFALGK